jgi:hypothetical protein
MRLPCVLHRFRATITSSPKKSLPKCPQKRAVSVYTVEDRPSGVRKQRTLFRFGGSLLGKSWLSPRKENLAAAYMRGREDSLREMLRAAFSEIEIRNQLIRALRDSKPIARKANSTK